MATRKQVFLYEALCEELGQEPDEEFQELEDGEAAKNIDELYEIKQEVNRNKDPEPKTWTPEEILRNEA